MAHCVASLNNEATFMRTDPNTYVPNSDNSTITNRDYKFFFLIIRCIEMKKRIDNHANCDSCWHNISLLNERDFTIICMHNLNITALSRLDSCF